MAFPMGESGMLTQDSGGLEWALQLRPMLGLNTWGLRPI